MMHGGAMANDERYLTFRGVAGVVLSMALDRFACVRRGHDPVMTGNEVVCRRCLTGIRR